MKIKKQHAFTMMELMVTLAIVGVTMMIALPSMNEFVKNERLTSYTNSLLADLMLARSKAVERNLPTILCASNNQTSCTGGSFKDGWIVGADENNSGSLDVGELIKVQQAIVGEININNTIGGTVLFDSRGFTPNTIGTITIDDNRGVAHQKSLTINRTGRVSR